MSMTSAIGNYISWRERHNARRQHEALPEDEEEPPSSPPLSSGERQDVEHGRSLTSSSSNNNNDDSLSQPTVESSSLRQRQRDEELGTAQDDEDHQQASSTSEEEQHQDSSPTIHVVPPSDTTDGIARRVTLAELEEEREMARRRTSVCILLAVFILFRLWIEALATGDIGLLLLSLIGTSWTARFIRQNREREEELDRRIEAYVENADQDNPELSRNEFRMLSFQAQLALAIMESQRNMMQGGFGHPDGNYQDEGVSDEAKQHWQTFSYKGSGGGKKKGGYGSVAAEDTSDDANKSELEEVPHCSICLSEYDNGDKLVRLPCSHIFHEECVGSWTSNHVRCPLCNFDLESVAGDAMTATTSSTTAATLGPEESIV